jgi:hypothetical protein
MAPTTIVRSRSPRGLSAITLTSVFGVVMALTTTCRVTGPPAASWRSDSPTPELVMIVGMPMLGGDVMNSGSVRPSKPSLKIAAAGARARTRRRRGVDGHHVRLEIT